jgi:site-specific DNA recombinase
MKAATTKPVRCAIYTRVSTDQGLEQDFNSLDAQRDAAEAYIRSAWTLIRSQYNDGGYSGGSTDRPALQRLLTEVRARKVDVIVVYKVDRLTRSLADFAKLVELFDGHGVSFVSVTQQFNTTTSMGRLTLNVLLSFAQFEREVTSERIRDKIAASKRKGLWVGGMVPLGYKVQNRKVVVIKNEAEIVRVIFKRYLELGSLNLLMQDLRQRKILTKVRRLSNGRAIGGNPLTRGPLAHLLRNRFYIGEVAFKGEILPGEQPPILDRKLFESVQRKLDEQRTSHSTTRTNSESLLMGRIFDDRGNRMTPSHASKNGKRYRYYLSSALVQGHAKNAGSVRRVSAPEIETLAINAVRNRLNNSSVVSDHDLINSQVARVEIQAERLAITLLKKGSKGSERKAEKAAFYFTWKKRTL